MNKRRYTGFTIVELLVVIVVLVILVTIVSVSYVGYRERAALNRKKTTETRLNQGMSEYVTKNGSYPPTFSTALSSDSALKALAPDVVSASPCNTKEKVCVGNSYYSSGATDKWTGYEYTYWLNDAKHWISIQKNRTPPNLAGAGTVTTQKRNCGTGTTATAWASCTAM